MSFKDRKRFEFEYSSGTWDYYTMRNPQGTETDQRGVLVRVKGNSESGRMMRDAAAKSGVLFSGNLVETAEDVPLLDAIRAHTPGDYKASYLDKSSGKPVSIEFPQELAALHEDYFRKSAAEGGFGEMAKDFRRMAEGETYDLERQFLRLAVSARIETEHEDMNASLANATRKLFGIYARDPELDRIPRDIFPIFAICLKPSASAVSHRNEGNTSFFESNEEERRFTSALLASKDESGCAKSLMDAVPGLTHSMASVMAKTYFRASEESRNMLAKECGKSGLITKCEMCKNNRLALCNLSEKMESLHRNSGLDAIATIASGELQEAIDAVFPDDMDKAKPSLDDFVRLHSKKDSPFSDGLWHEGEIQKLDKDARDIFHTFKSSLESRWDRHTAKMIFNNFGEIFSLCSEGLLEENSRLTEGDKRSVMAAAVSVFESRIEAKALRELSAPDDRQYSLEELFDPRISVDSGRIALQPFGLESPDLCQKSMFINTYLDSMAQIQAEKVLKRYYRMVEHPAKAHRLQIPNAQWFKGVFKGISMKESELTPEGAGCVYALARSAVRENYKAANYILNGCRPLPSGDIPDAKIVGGILDRLPKGREKYTFEEVFEAGLGYSKSATRTSQEALLEMDSKTFGELAEKMAEERQKLVHDRTKDVSSAIVNTFMPLFQAIDAVG